MSRQYSPRRFFRQSPNRFLHQYFSNREMLTTIDFGALRETQAEPIYEAWLALSEIARNETEQDFQEIDELATEGGSKAILAEARGHGEELGEKFAELQGFHEHAFWTFLERPNYWRGAVAFHHADTIPSSYWRKRKNLPRKAANLDATNIRVFEGRIGHYFHIMQGRGQNCKVDHYKRDGLDYFFAYPEDYAQAHIEWEGKEFKRRSHNPAFEIIFVFSEHDGTLDIYLSGDRKPVADLQIIFADVILKAELGPDKKDERVYNLSLFCSRSIRFVYGVELGIERVIVKKIRLSVHGTREKIILEVDPSQPKSAIFDLLDKVTSDPSLEQFSITQVGIKVTFAPNPSSRRTPTRSFEITSPNSCSLRHDGRDLYIRRMLADSGIEPREPVKEEA